MDTWLVTGATGFLGANAGAWLGHKVRRVGLSRGTPSTELFDDSHSVDLLDSAGVARAIAAAKPDVVLHTAALASHEACALDPARAHAINAQATEVVASAAERVGAHFIFVSTDAVFGAGDGDYRETDLAEPDSAYGASKLAGEQLAIQACPDTLVIRTNFFGWSPSGRRSILEFFANAVEARASVPGFTDYIVTSIYAQQLIAAVRELVALKCTGVVHVASSDALSKYEFGERVADQLVGESDLIVPASATHSSQTASRARNQSLNTELAESLLGHPMPSQLDGIAAAISDAGLRSQLRRTAASSQ